MKVRLGYVSIALNLPKITASGTITYTNYQKFPTEEKKLSKLKSVTLSNLNALYEILQYNIKNEIHFYRITSALIPLATHPEVLWQYRDIFKKDFERIGILLNRSSMRVDTHPDEFNVLNSMKKEVIEASIRNLMIHVNLFEDILYPKGKMVIHVGSSAGGKEVALKRFKDTYGALPEEIATRLMIENDDKTFTTEEVLGLCKEISIPMVLDVHHHNCNNNGEKLEALLGEILNTWEGEAFPAKFHFSTPKEGGLDKKHADYINPEDFVKFIELCCKFNKDIDVMLEAKKKDLALFQLVYDLKQIRPNWKWEDNSTFIPI